MLPAIYKIKERIKMAIAEEKIFQNSKELLYACIEKVNENQRGKVGGNVALYPTVIVMLGEKSKAYTKYIKNTLDDNWNNAEFLKYIYVEKDENTWKCSVLSDNKEKKELKWKSVEGAFEDIFSRAVMDMTGLETIFHDKNYIKMEFVMDSTEVDGESYYELYLNINHGMQNVNLKTFYLMYDAAPMEGRKIKSENMLRYLLEKRNNEQGKCGTTYVLSNFLQSGGNIENRIWQNYRLAADIILLGGNEDSDRNYAGNLYNGIKTASYYLVEKPVEEIVFVSLKSLMEQLREREKEHFFKELSEEQIRERLGITATQEFAEAEEIFKENILKKLPVAEDLKYLPISSEKALKELQKMKRVTQEAADKCTMGVWSLFIQEKYIGKVKQYLLNKEEIQYLVKEMREMLHMSFSGYEIMNMRSKRDLLIQMLSEDLKFRGVREGLDYKEQLHERALFECKKYFYKSVKEILINEFKSILEEADNYKELYQNCENELYKEEILISGNKDDSLEKQYHLYVEKVNEYISEHQKINTAKSAFPNVFDIRLTKEGLLYSVWNVFLDLIQKEVYEYDFEKELHWRMSHKSEEDCMTDVSKEFQENLEKYIRLSSKTNILAVLTKRCKFYLVNNNAKYAAYFANLDAYKNGEFMLFNLNRTDCIEQIGIYDITNPEKILET